MISNIYDIYKKNKNNTSTCIYKFERHTDQIKILNKLSNQPFKLNTHDSNKPMTVI